MSIFSRYIVKSVPRKAYSSFFSRQMSSASDSIAYRPPRGVFDDIFEREGFRLPRPPPPDDLEFRVALRGERLPSCFTHMLDHCTIRGIRHNDTFARSEAVVKLCETSEDKRYARARNARLIMSNEVPDMPTDDVKPYCFWHPDTANEETYRLLATRYPDMAYSVGRACAVAGYDGLYHELDILPEVSIAEEAGESSAANAGSKAIFDHIMKQPVCYAVLDDYTRSVHHQNPRSPAFVNGDTAVRSTLDVTVTPRDIPEWCDTRHCFNIAEDYHVAEVTTHKYFFASQGTLPPEHVELLYSPLPSHLPTTIKDPLIVMAAYEGNLDRYLRLRRPEWVEQEHGAILRGIYHNTTFAKWWSLQPREDISGDIRAAYLARFIMVNDLSHITETDPHPKKDYDEIPGMIWWPLIPAEETLKALAKRRPDMHLQVAMACIAGNYKELWDKLAPKPSRQLYEQASLCHDASVRNHFVDYLERRASELGLNVKALEEVNKVLAHDWCWNAARLDKEPTSCWLPSEISIPGQSGYPDTDNVYGSPDQTNLAGEGSNWELYICSSEESRAKIPASRSQIERYDSDDEWKSSSRPGLLVRRSWGESWLFIDRKESGFVQGADDEDVAMAEL